MFNFASLPKVNISRSVFPRPTSLKTTFNAGDLIPIYWEDVMPGDTVNFDMNAIVRMATPLHPVMDDAYLDIHCFFVPNRLIWDHWVNFMGENTESAWVEPQTYAIPQVRFNGSATSGSLADYLGLPVAPVVALGTVSAMPFRAYRLIWNEWYRDQNLQDPVLVNTGDAVSTQNSVNQLLKVNRYKDYFSSCLPQPQKGINPTIPLSSEPVPVYPLGYRTDLYPNQTAMNLVDSNGDKVVNGAKFVGYNGAAGSKNLFFASAGIAAGQASFVGNDGALTPTNLYADLTSVTAPTVNMLRQAFAVQRLLEADMYGTRYRELILSHFNVQTGDARVQVPEYLGGRHIPINVQQVIQQSSTDKEPSVLGNTGAFSKTVDRNSYFTKSFTEHGILMVLASVRVIHSYQNGIERKFLRKGRYDFYWPELAHIGEQPVYTKEIFADADDDHVFGYQEAWADYRYSPNRVSGAMRSGVSGGSLDVWHYADNYFDIPYLSESWLQEDDRLIGRTLAVTDSNVSDQFIAHFGFNPTWVRPMPVHSVPGLTGHF